MNLIAPLLADRSPNLRMLVLRDLLGRTTDDAEIVELTALKTRDPLVGDLTALQRDDGSWRRGDGSWRGHTHPLMMTCMALVRLGYLGFGAEHDAVRRGAEFLFARQKHDGSWALPRVIEDDAEGVTETSLQTSMPLRALALCGYATEARAEKAYEWLSSRRLDDGAWPTGKTRGDFKRVAGYRRLAHSKLGCRANTTAALQCLSLHPVRRSSPEARRGLDLLLGRETRDAHALGFEVARLMGAEPVRGFISFFARFDTALVLDLCARIGASREDARVADAIEFVTALQGPNGLWSHRSAPHCDRWLSYDILRSLSRIDESTDWISMEPRTPFQPYGRKRKRY
ncbi:MAG: hypothetical protein O7H39_12630 [Gammaproteobacteria bacterium]|nr:hypothetical protein [Gammaproteobacteria bacterium]